MNLSLFCRFSTFKGQLDGEIFELLYSLSDFVTFKEMILDYKSYKSGNIADVGASIVIQRLSSDEDVVDAQQTTQMSTTMDE